MMVWPTIAIISIGLSCLATGITSFHLWRRWDLHVSSVRWLFFVFFASLFAHYLFRLSYFAVAYVEPAATYYSGADADSDRMADRYSTVGIFAPLHFQISHDKLVTALLIIGDTCYFSVASWTFPLVYELGEIGRKSMDRGAEKEGEQIRWYLWRVWPMVAVFGVVESVVAAVVGGYSTYTQCFQLAVYFLQFITVCYMVWIVAKLAWGGRKYEHVQGAFVTSPVYQRLSRIIFIYAIFALQYQLTSVVTYATQKDTGNYMGISAAIYYSAGVALTITSMCSQTCVLEMCRCCLPDDVEAQLEAGLQQPLSPRDAQMGIDSEPPRVNPVFVFTDIQQSSALWGVGDGRIMQQATEIHDNILRSVLLKYRGYEITTAGDAFQLAFHTIREAVEYCLAVQRKLLEADWPRELHGLIPATKKQRARGRLLFRGLRVRMGIHDAVDSDGSLVVDIHAVTGKIIYTGASEVIANEIGDLGDGGQILVTRRVADWLQMYADLVACSVDRIGQYTVPQINSTVEIFQVASMELKARKRMFTTTLKRRTHPEYPGVSSPHSIHDNDTTPPGLSILAAQRRRKTYAQRELRRQLGQGALGRAASHQALLHAPHKRDSARTNSM